MTTSLTHARLRELLDYNPETGVFTWRVHRERYYCAGKIAGTTDKHGRHQIQIDKKIYRAGSLALFWMTGRMAVADHINCDPSDDRWSNLRKATPAQNGANKRPHKRKLYSPLKGVTVNWHGRFQAQIGVNGCNIYLGLFDTAEAAHAAYVAAAKKYFGAFARSS